MIGIKKYLNADETCIDSLRATDFGAKSCLITDKRIIVSGKYYEKTDDKWKKTKGHITIDNHDIRDISWDKQGNLFLHILMLVLFWFCLIVFFILILYAALQMTLLLFYMLFFVSESAKAMKEAASEAICTGGGLIVATIIFRILSHVFDYHRLMCISCSKGIIGIPYSYKSKARRQKIEEHFNRHITSRKTLHNHLQ